MKSAIWYRLLIAASMIIGFVSAGYADIDPIQPKALERPFVVPMPAVPLVIPTPAPPGPSDTVNGIYVVDGVHHNKIDQKVLDSSVVDGVLVEVPWSAIEPVEGSFDWTTIDALLAQAAAVNKKVSLILGAGWQTPSWVYQDGAKQFDFVWDQPKWGPTLCSAVSIPVPWDPIYLARWATLVKAAGSRYDGNQTIASVKVTGINSKTQETFLPTSNQSPIRGDSHQCTSYDDIANWAAAGYTRLKVESAWAAVLEDFSQSFPDKRVEPMLVPGGFPAIDDNGNVFSARGNQDTEVTNDIVASGVSDYPAQFVVQNDGWSASWIWEVEASYSSRVPVGFQENFALKAQAPAAIDTALKSNASYLELYEHDVLDASLQSALVAAHQALQ